MTRRPMSALRARAVIESAALVKAPTWSEDRHWHVVDGDGKVLVVVAPSYGGVSQSGRNGWQWWLAGSGPSSATRPEKTCEQAAVAGLDAWERWATTRPSP
ncbi:hypothetical protein [Streptomyces sparsogenes]|nr:hypothetical protein [Streptomyces sparsogenes]